MTALTEDMLARMARLDALKAFAEAIEGVKVAAGSEDDRNAAMWVGSALHGLAKGFADHGSEAAAAIVHDMGAQIVRALASGEWRKDLPT